MVIYGDASRSVVLEGAHLTTARVVAVTIPDPAVHRLVVQLVRDLCPYVPIVARANLSDDLPQLYKDGANEVILPAFEGGLEMLRQTLLRLGVSVETIQTYTDLVHKAHYEPWQRSQPDQEMLGCLRRAAGELTIQWYQLDEHSHHLGQTLGSLRIRQITGASIVAILRDCEVLVNPEGSTQLLAYDRLAVLGTTEQRKEFLAWLTDSQLPQDALADAPLLDDEQLTVLGPPAHGSGSDRP
jgi:CPA2 family monovalent cation:H+ antiporter-2